MMLTNILLGALVTTAFRFVVAIDGLPLGAFTECTLPTIEWEVEEVKEGGLNTYVHQLPGRRKATRITLKNGVVMASDLLIWCTRAMEEDFSRKTVTVTLLNSLFVPVMVWNIENAYPLKWSGPPLKTSDNTIALQTFELACGEITVV